VDRLAFAYPFEDTTGAARIEHYDNEEGRFAGSVLGVLDDEPFVALSAAH
jgi:hypothetical protein